MKPKTGSHHFSDQVDYNLQGSTVIITPKKTGSDILRIAEVWGLAYYNWLTKEKKTSVDKIIFDITTLNINNAILESFKRRISYLNLNNPFRLEIISTHQIQLYSKHELENPPDDGVIINEFKLRASDDKAGRLEKDFQAFLLGADKVNNSTDFKLMYRRLGLLGIDFYNLVKNYRLIREFPTGVFKNTKAESNRILPTYFIDIVAFNKHNELSLIELKLNDTKLQVISQLLDYALFGLAYKKKLVESIEKHIGKEYCPDNLLKKPISCYVANNLYHVKFKDLKEYYSPNNKGFNLKFYKIVLGETTAF